MKDKRKVMFGALVLLMVVAMVLVACAQPAPTPAPKPAPEPILIGITEDLSGFSRDAGNAKMEAAIMAIEQWNARGGVHGGIEVKYVTRDNAGDPAKATTIAREFVQMGVTAVIGGTSSTVAIPESKVLTAAKIPLMTGSAAMGIFHEGPDGKVYAFTSSGTNVIHVQVVLNDMAKQGHKKIALVVSNVAWPKDLAVRFKEQIKQTYGPKHGIELVYDAAVDVQATDLSTEVLRLRKLEFDALYVVFYPGNVHAYVRALADIGWRPPPLTYILWDLALSVYRTADKSLFAGFRPYSVHNAVKPSSIKKRGEYMTRWGHEPRSGNWAMGYEEANLLLKALDAVGAADGATIVNYLETKIKGEPIITGPKGATADYTMDTLHSLGDVENIMAFLNIDEKGKEVWD